MSSAQNQVCVIPAPAERARTLAARAGTAAVMAAGVTGRLMPMLHQVSGEGSVVLLLAQDQTLPSLIEVAPGGEVPAMIELTDMAPVPVRRSVRGLLWITGWLRVLDQDQGRRTATMWAVRRPDPRLLDVGHTARMLGLDPVFVVFSDSQGSGWLSPATLAGAEPDPFCHLERAWLEHLERYHPDVIRAVVQHLTEAGSHRPDARVWPLGIDRLGVWLRIEDAGQERDLRLAFRRPATTPLDLARELYGLLGYPTAGHQM